MLEELPDDSLMRKADRLAEVEMQLDTLEAEKKSLREEIVNAMKALGLQNFKTAAGRQPYLTTQNIYSVAPENKERVPQFLDEHGHGDVIQERYVDSRSLQSRLKQIAEKGEALPEWIVPTQLVKLGFRGK